MCAASIIIFMALASYACCLLGKGIWARSVRSPIRGWLVVLGGCMCSKQRQDSIRAGDKSRALYQVGDRTHDCQIAAPNTHGFLLLCSTFLDL